MRYCLVENGKVKLGPILLPKIWNNISNFNLLDTETLISYGWLPHTFIETSTPGQIIEGSNFQILSDSVIETQISRDPTEMELQQMLEEKWKRFRVIRNYALTICDWTQLSDNGLLTEKKDEWATYRQLLRDLTSTNSNPESIIFPVDPNGERISEGIVPYYILSY